MQCDNLLRLLLVSVYPQAARAIIYCENLVLECRNPVAVDTQSGLVSSSLQRHGLSRERTWLGWSFVSKERPPCCSPHLRSA
jgi:hypothetical protein